MVTEIQKKEIKKRMRAIKDATDAGRPQEVINRRVKNLTDYLQAEGIINPFDD